MDNYNNRKYDNIQKAKLHYEEMSNNYAKEIEQSIANSIIYDGVTLLKESTITSYKSPKCILIKSDTVSAIYKYDKVNQKLACLNFASYKYPGGKFLEGSTAQEECLCHESTLYNILKHFEDSYYQYNRQHTNRSLYTDRAIYTPDVLFVHNNKPLRCAVITCASPNLHPAYMNRTQSLMTIDNTDALQKRISFIKNIAEHNGVDALILGAFGCGVFRQDPYEVALMFKDIFVTSSVSTIIYAITPGRNYDVFRYILSDVCEVV